jgi:hypothetical protein
MEINLNPEFLGEYLKGPEIEAVLTEIGEGKALPLAKAKIAKRSGALADSAEFHTEIGGIRNDRHIGVLTVGQGLAYGAAHEFGAGDHPGSTGRHHNPPAHELDAVLEELGGL